MLYPCQLFLIIFGLFQHYNSLSFHFVDILLKHLNAFLLFFKRLLHLFGLPVLFRHLLDLLFQLLLFLFELVLNSTTLCSLSFSQLKRFFLVKTLKFGAKSFEFLVILLLHREKQRILKLHLRFLECTQQVLLIFYLGVKLFEMVLLLDQLSFLSNDLLLSRVHRLSIQNYFVINLTRHVFIIVTHLLLGLIFAYDDVGSHLVSKILYDDVSYFLKVFYLLVKCLTKPFILKKMGILLDCACSTFIPGVLREGSLSLHFVSLFQLFYKFVQLCLLALTIQLQLFNFHLLTLKIFGVLL